MDLCAYSGMIPSITFTAASDINIDNMKIFVTTSSGSGGGGRTVL